MQQDTFFPLLWRLIKVVWRYARFVYAVFFAAVALMNLFEFRLLPALLTAGLALLIWPGSINRFFHRSSKKDVSYAP